MATFTYFCKQKKVPFDMHTPDYNMRTPLHWAVHSMSSLSLEYIIASLNDLDQKDDFGMTPF